MKNPLQNSSSLSTPGLLLGKTSARSEVRESSEVVRERKVDSGTVTLRSAERKGLIDEDRWLSLDRRRKTSRQKISSDSLDTVSQQEPLTTSDSPQRSNSPGKEADLKKVKSFWVDLDNDTQRKKSQETSVSREKKLSHSRSRSVSRGKSVEPVPDYDDDRNKPSTTVSDTKSKGSKIKRGSQVVKKKRELEKQSYDEGSLAREYDRGRRDSSLDRDGGRGFPLVKADSRSNTLNRSRRGTIYDENINRDGFLGGNNNGIVAKKSNSSNPDESKHFLSLQLFTKVKDCDVL